VTHVEWWAHTRSTEGSSFGHQLHFDCDERKLGKVCDV
jgi:hypothetical protein